MERRDEPVQRERERWNAACMRNWGRLGILGTVCVGIKAENRNENGKASQPKEARLESEQKLEQDALSSIFHAIETNCGFL